MKKATIVALEESFKARRRVLAYRRELKREEDLKRAEAARRVIPSAAPFGEEPREI